MDIIFIHVAIATNSGEDKTPDGMKAFVPVFQLLLVAIAKEFPGMSFHTLVLQASVSLLLSSLLLKTLILPKNKALGSDETRLCHQLL